MNSGIPNSLAVKDFVFNPFSTSRIRCSFFFVSSRFNVEIANENLKNTIKITHSR